MKGLQSTLPDLWLEMGIDRFAYALPDRVLGQPTWPLLSGTFDRRPVGWPVHDRDDPARRTFIGGMHATAAALADAGLNVIVDHVLLEQAWLDECSRTLGEVRGLFVGARTGRSR